MSQYFKIQEPGDRSPVAVAFVSDENLIYRFVPGIGLVDWPAMAMWVGGGDELGATQVTEAEAKRLMAAGVGAFPEGFDYSSEVGSAPTLRVSV